MNYILRFPIKKQPHSRKKCINVGVGEEDQFQGLKKIESRNTTESVSVGAESSVLQIGKRSQAKVVIGSILLQKRKEKEKGPTNIQITEPLETEENLNDSSAQDPSPTAQKYSNITATKILPSDIPHVVIQKEINISGHMAKRSSPTRTTEECRASKAKKQENVILKSDMNKTLIGDRESVNQIKLTGSVSASSSSVPSVSWPACDSERDQVTKSKVCKTSTPCASSDLEIQRKKEFANSESTQRNTAKLKKPGPTM